MKATLIILSILAFILGGCAITGSSSAFDKDGIPKQQYYVGGGFAFSYKALQPGTFYIVEKNTKKFVVTKSMVTKECFEESIDPTDGNIPAGLKSLGVDPENMEFSFYFVPANVPATEADSK